MKIGYQDKKMKENEWENKVEEENREREREEGKEDQELSGERVIVRESTRPNRGWSRDHSAAVP